MQGKLLLEGPFVWNSDKEGTSREGAPTLRRFHCLWYGYLTMMYWECDGKAIQQVYSRWTLGVISLIWDGEPGSGSKVIWVHYDVLSPDTQIEGHKFVKHCPIWRSSTNFWKKRLCDLWPFRDHSLIITLGGLANYIIRIGLLWSAVGMTHVLRCRLVMQPRRALSITLRNRPDPP